MTITRASKGGAPLREAIARNADGHAQDLALVIKRRSEWWGSEPSGDRGGARHADVPERTLAHLHGDYLLERLGMRD